MADPCNCHDGASFYQLRFDGVQDGCGEYLDTRTCDDHGNTKSRVLTGTAPEILAQLLRLLPELEQRFPGEMGERDLAQRLRMHADAIAEVHGRIVNRSTRAA